MINEHCYNKSYKGQNLRQIAFPVGGIGAGMFCIEGAGAISHMSVRNKPEIFNEPGIFAAIFVRGIKNGAKVLEGPVPDWKIFGLPRSGLGNRGSILGLPRFENAEFKSGFPFCFITLEHENIPLTVKIKGWSPFIPADADNSSLPVGAMEYTFKNKSRKSLDIVFSFNARNFMRCGNKADSIRKIKNGFVLSQKGTTKEPWLQGDFAVFTDQENTITDHCWFRGDWFDPLTMVWKKISGGDVTVVSPVKTAAPGASLYVVSNLQPGKSKTIRLMTAWYVPFTDIRTGGDDECNNNCDSSKGCCPTTSGLGYSREDESYSSGNHRPWYSKRFKNIFEVASYWEANYNDLYRKTKLFSDSFYSSTLPPEIIEAVSANLSILKSPTVLRQYDGRLWAYEGCNDDEGCCSGSCTHVWNYAQAIPHLFPTLERTLRNTEFCENQSPEGHQTFRAALPVRPVAHDFYAAADGQLGGIMKVYRDWRISGDSEWLKKLYPVIKKSMDYCISTWDPRNKGVIEEPHHNTYDIEFWGPEPLCTGFYLGALNAIILMGKYLNEDISVYESLYKKGKVFIETELYNGEYFFQKIIVIGLNAPNPAIASTKSFGGNYSEEAKNLLEKEGPKYQYGMGCLSDGMLGIWIAQMCGLDDIIDPNKVKSHLLAVYKYNFKKNLINHVNPQRSGYALGNEGGLLLCTWPKGGMPSLPFVYSNEIWTGIEYQAASHLILMGKVKEGLEIVRTCRDRYGGKIRNPFDEYECGHWYARALSSYGLIQSLTGVRYDAVDKVLYIDSRIGDFKSFLSTETGFGTVTLSNNKPSVSVVYGSIPIKRIFISGKSVKLSSSDFN
jgi:uncharacterized protein (DUF608 family)